MTTGLLVIDKPEGITSAGVVTAVRRATGIKKAGHAGTLDPMATGVLVVALGPATRLVRYVQDGAKEYVATVQFGVATESLDADGDETERAPMNFAEAELRQALEGFKGQSSQIPPMVSAVKVGGKRLYELARAGKEVARDPRLIYVTELELVDIRSRARLSGGHAASGLLERNLYPDARRRYCPSTRRPGTSQGTAENEGRPFRPGGRAFPRRSRGMAKPAGPAR